MVSAFASAGENLKSGGSIPLTATSDVAVEPLSSRAGNPTENCLHPADEGSEQPVEKQKADAQKYKSNNS